MFLFGGDFSPDGSDILEGIEVVISNRGNQMNLSGPCHAPTHTEDGIPIRKIYISNLPYKTTRTEVFELFAQYGFIKSCWVKMVDDSAPLPQITPYAFVTYTKPSDAHRALMAPNYKHTIRGRRLRVSPADSWHQPIQDAQGNIVWNCSRKPLKPEESEPNSSVPNEEAHCSNQPEETSESGSNILDVLNSDCLSYIMSFLSIRDLIICEGLSKRWMAVIQNYFQSFRCFRTSSWSGRNLTTAQFRILLQKFGSSLISLHIDDHSVSLNDRTAHTIGKFCPNLENLYVTGMFTKNWKPVIYSCSNLRSVSFYECIEIDDATLSSLLGPSSTIESLVVHGNRHVTGKFLINHSSQLHTLTLYNCYNINAASLTESLSKLPNLKSLNLSHLNIAVWQAIPTILASFHQLEELHLCYYYTSLNTPRMDDAEEELYQALERLTDLKVLVMSKNDFVNNKLLQRVSKACTKLTSLNISACRNKLEREKRGVQDVTNVGLVALSQNCRDLQNLDISHWTKLNEGVGALANCKELRELCARSVEYLTGASLIQCISGCPLLQVVDVNGCENITQATIADCVSVMEQRSLPLKLLISNSSSMYDNPDSLPQHRLLTVIPYELIHRTRHSSEDTLDSDDYNMYSVEDDDEYNDFFDDYDEYSDYCVEHEEVDLADEEYAQELFDAIINF